MLPFHESWLFKQRTLTSDMKTLQVYQFLKDKVHYYVLLPKMP